MRRPFAARWHTWPQNLAVRRVPSGMGPPQWPHVRAASATTSAWSLSRSLALGVLGDGAQRAQRRDSRRRSVPFPRGLPCLPGGGQRDAPLARLMAPGEGRGQRGGPRDRERLSTLPRLGKSPADDRQDHGAGSCGGPRRVRSFGHQCPNQCPNDPIRAPLRRQRSSAFPAFSGFSDSLPCRRSRVRVPSAAPPRSPFNHPGLLRSGPRRAVAGAVAASRRVLASPPRQPKGAVTASAPFSGPRPDLPPRRADGRAALFGRRQVGPK